MTKTPGTLAELTTQARGWSFNDTFRHQFRLGPSPAIVSNHWQKRQLGPLWLEHCPDLPLTVLVDENGQICGVFLGIGVDGDGRVLGDKSVSRYVVDRSFDAVEDWLGTLAGRYVVVLTTDDAFCLYPDACNSFSVVFHPEAQVAASSTTLAISDQILPIPGADDGDEAFHLFGETSDRRVHLAMANHVLDLTDFQQRRFWPKDETDFSRIPDFRMERVAARMARRLRQIVVPLVRTFPSTLPLSGGRDSRLLVAASLPAAEAVKDYYVFQINWAGTHDLESARRVVDFLSLPLKTQQIGSSEWAAKIRGIRYEEMRGQMQLSSGFMIEEFGDHSLEAFFNEPPNQILLRGGAGELTHANKWPPPKMPVTPERAFDCLTNRPYEALEKAVGSGRALAYWHRYQTWFNALPEVAKPNAIDLAHCELWLPIMSAFYHSAAKNFYINPFAERSLNHLAMRFDPTARKRLTLVRALLDALAPGLSDIPYSRDLIKEERRAKAASSTQ